MPIRIELMLGCKALEIGGGCAIGPCPLAALFPAKHIAVKNAVFQIVR